MGIENNELESARPLSSIAWAIMAALLFGMSTPFAKILTRQIDPVILSGILYLGSGIGLALWVGLRNIVAMRFIAREAPLSRRDFPWLAAATLTGGMIGPAFLMIGLRITSSSTASLLLNLETVFTFLIAWLIFRESAGKRIIIGAAAIVVGGILLSRQGGEIQVSFWGPVCIAIACLAWGIDNNLTRRISTGDPVLIAAIKGLVAGSANIGIGIIAGRELPGVSMACWAALLGFLGYGLSLVFFILSLRHLGAARTSAYFAAAPFIGALASFAILGETVSCQFVAAALLIAAGIYLHIIERHIHEHIHQEFIHEHPHRHDEHHRHSHDRAVPHDMHTHSHRHSPLIHSHPHYPDIHHQHPH
jgi:drug/metabolite transporter (DMT)-like permease